MDVQRRNQLFGKRKCAHFTKGGILDDTYIMLVESEFSKLKNACHFKTRLNKELSIIQKIKHRSNFIITPENLD